MFRFDTSNTVKTKTLQIYNVNGQMVYKGEIPSAIATTNINVGYLSKGLYIGKLISGKQKSSFKLVKN